jgi:hypothetical protein
MKVLRPLTLAVLALVSADSAQAQSQPSAPLSAAARSQFDFLIGEWRTDSIEQSGKVTSAPDNRFVFTKLADQGAIESQWHFDRGTPGKPDYTNARYYSGYDDRTTMWTFYYISDKSAQFWPGKYENGVWYFLHDFTIDGKPVLQRQWWESVDQKTIRRHIENRGEDGSFRPVYVATLKRVA